MAEEQDSAITIFDVDRTLTRRPTYSAFLIHAALRHAPWRLLLLPALLPTAIGYAAGRTPRKRMKEAMHRIALGARLDRKHAEPLAEAFAKAVVEHGLFREAAAAIARQKAEGRSIMLATAAPELYIAPLARQLGIDMVLASRNSWEGGWLTPAIGGENCYGPDKLAMIRASLEAQGIDRTRAHIRFFSDHISDVPTFEWADEAYLVNPSPKLRAIGRQRGWQELDWRSA
ncbi:HAD-IB family hydrolase [Sphingomonas sp. 1P06PA]|uniref:HAD family hydrolase n=1 Tax=Sphingomonas sp. 1P06PA TaxID=554121 RepID=UPI0039A4ECC2